MRYIITTDNSTVSFSLCEDDTVKSVLQNIALLMTTKKGTVPMYREFGLPMVFIDKPLEVAQTLMAAEVKEAIEEFEPRATFIGLSCERNSNNFGSIIAKLEIEI